MMMNYAKPVPEEDRKKLKSMLRKRECLNCDNVIESYPLDPPGSLHCDLIEEYVKPDFTCEKWQPIIIEDEEII